MALEWSTRLSLKHCLEASTSVALERPNHLRLMPSSSLALERPMHFSNSVALEQPIDSYFQAAKILCTRDPETRMMRRPLCSARLASAVLFVRSSGTC